MIGNESCALTWAVMMWMCRCQVIDAGTQSERRKYRQDDDDEDGDEDDDEDGDEDDDEALVQCTVLTVLVVSK